MPYFLKINTKDEFNFVKRIVDNSHTKFHAHPSEYAEYLDIVDALKENFDHPMTPMDIIHAGEDAIARESDEKYERGMQDVIPRPSRKKSRKKQPEVADLPALCKEHPKFKAQRAPRTDCKQCWKVYKELNPNIYDAARRNFVRKQRSA